MATYGLEFSDIYGRIKDYANLNNVVGADTKAKKAANDALRLIASMRDWEILKRQDTLTPTVSTAAITLSTYASSFDHPLSCWYLSNGNRMEIELVDDDRWNREVDEDDDGDPQIARITKASGTLKIEFSPRPSASFVSAYSTIYFDFVKKPTELSADGDVPEIPDTSEQLAIVYLAVSDLLAKQGDMEGMATWEAKAQRLLVQAQKNDGKRVGRNISMGKPLVPINCSKGNRINDYD